MKRVSITNNSGQWFDSEKAECFKENTYWNGSNHISKATNSQFEHEAIYITKTGKFILNHWSQWQGSIETYKAIGKEEAARWFCKQDFSDDKIPEVFKEEVCKLEIK